MSHLSKIELEINDLKVLGKACSRLGLEIKLNQKNFIWFGRENALCDHAIKVPGARYEIGVIKEGNNFNLQCDFFDRGVEEKIGKNGGLLKQAYAIEKAKWEAVKKGYSCREIRTEKGIQLRISVG